MKYLARKKCTAHTACFSPVKKQGKVGVKLRTPQKVFSSQKNNLLHHIDSKNFARNTAQYSATAISKLSKSSVCHGGHEHTGTPDATSAPVAALLTRHDIDTARARAVRLLLTLRGAIDPEARPGKWALVRAPETHGKYLVVSADSGPAIEVSEEHLKEIESMEDVDVQQYLEACFE